MRLFVRTDVVMKLRGRLIWIGVLMVLLGIGFVIRFTDLQILSGSEYARLSESNFIKVRRLPAMRGRIFDRNGVILADNNASYSVNVTPAFVKDADSLVLKLASYLNLSHREIVRLNRTLHSTRGLARFREYTVRTALDRKQVALLVSRQDELKGVTLPKSYERFYPHKDLLVHTVGYVGQPREKDLKNDPGLHPDTPIGKQGIEFAFESVLRGVDGEQKVIVDSLGLEKTDKDIMEMLGDKPVIPPKPGNDVYTSLDIRLQQTALDAFKDFDGGAVVAMNAKTGEVLASISKPGYDPNDFVHGIPHSIWNKLRDDVLHPLLNKGVQAAYFPGSTFKPLMAYIAAAENVIMPREKVTCKGVRLLGKHRFHCWNHGGHGRMDMVHAMAQSCDVYFYEIGSRIGIEKINTYAAKFGLGQRTGIILPNEKRGVMPDKVWHKKVHGRSWSIGDTYNTSIGQGDVMMTPMQLAVMYAAIFNGGMVLRPRILEHVETRSGDIIQRGSRQIIRSIEMDLTAVDLVRKGVEAVVNEKIGTAYYRGRSKNIVIAGKTGTAQVKRIHRNVAKTEDDKFLEKDHALFAGFSPPDDPEIVVVAMAEHGEHGSWVSPVVKAVIERYFELKIEDSSQAERHQ